MEQSNTPMSSPDQLTITHRTYVLHDPPEPDPEFQRLLETTWSERHDAGVGFRYKLHIERQRVIEGQFGFLLLLNRHRLAERRQPQNFQLAAPFDPTKFNFNRVEPAEVLLELRLPGPAELAVSLVINNSPVTPHHTLVLPERECQWPQTINPASLHIALELMLRLPDRRYRLGYNSPGALASVNHLHLHLLRIDRDLYVQSAKLVPIRDDPLLHRFVDHLPAQGYCYVLRDQTDIRPVCTGLHRLLTILIKRNLAHNIFWTWTHLRDFPGSELRVLVYPRLRQCENKVACSFNAAFLELSGFVSVGEANDFERLTEDGIREALREAQGDVYSALRDVLPDAIAEIHHESSLLVEGSSPTS